MACEVWATYSVKDHLDRRALAADIMLFDRLVFPVPQSADLRFQEVDATKPGPVVWSKNAVEWARWEKEKWRPEAQESLLELIKPVIRKVPWDVPRQEEWRNEFAKAAGDHAPGYAFAATRTVLTRDLPAYVTGVEAMGPAYRTVEQLEQELGVGKDRNHKTLPASALAAVMGWKLVVPDDPRLSDEELLKETSDFVTGDAEFRRHRTDFWEWQKKYLKDGVTDRESIEAAARKMQELLERQNASARRLPVEKGVRYAFRIAPSALALGGHFLGPAGVVPCIAAGAFLTCAQIAAEKWFFKTPQGGNGPSPAAFVHDIHRHFGWE